MGGHLLQRQRACWEQTPTCPESGCEGEEGEGGGAAGARRLKAELRAVLQGELRNNGQEIRIKGLSR